MQALVVGVGILAGLGARRPAAAAPLCQGDYAEDLSALSPEARALETSTPPYSYAVRTTAVYECVAYGADGNLRKTRTPTTAYGTAFGLRADGPDTLLVTNEHVAEWPAVTDDDHPVDGVPEGCKRISDALAIVDDDHDEYSADDVPLSRAVVDLGDDIAVLRAHAKLQVIPWAIGRSAGISARDAVEVKGFPLGEFRATNVGKVVSAYAHDTQGAWSHDDFVIDALLTSGGSGSPVLAVSCKTGAFELVGVFHARYAAASALNVVVAIDQLHELLTTLKRPAAPAGDAQPGLDAAARARLVETVRHDPGAPFFSVGALVASVRARADGTLVFAVFAADFPRSTSPLLVITDAPGDDPRRFGKLAEIYLGGAQGLQLSPAAGLDADAQASFERAATLLREDALAAYAQRARAHLTPASRDAADRLRAKQRAFERMLAGQRDAAQALTDTVARVVPATSGGAALSLADVEAGPRADAPPPGALASTTP